jgi:uncharacterized protein YggT (Ycf19 family)
VAGVATERRALVPDILAQLHLLHTLVQIIFIGLIICLWARIILSWLTMVFLRPDAPIIRLFDRIVAPMLEPVRRRIPTMSLGMFDMSYIIAYLVIFWVLTLLNVILQSVLPSGW